MTPQSDELATALQRFQTLFDPVAIHALQPPTPNTIYTPAVVVWLMVFQRLHGNVSLQLAVDELLRRAHDFPHTLPNNRRIQHATLATNTAAYSRARTRLDTEVANGLADAMFNTLLDATPPSWQGRRVMIVDGTTSKLASSEALRTAYPPASNQHGTGAWPILHWAVAHELASGCAVRPETGAMYGPNAIGEVALARGLLPRIPAHSVLMADRNFGVFAFYYHAHQAGHDLVTRLTEARFHAMVRRAQPDGPSRWKLVWKPTPAERKKHPELPADAEVSVMLHERIVTDAKGQSLKLWLVTTLVSVAGESLAALYRHRQDVESDIRDVKVALKMNDIHSQSAEMVEKELAMGMMAYNLVVQVRRLAAARMKLEPRRLSFTGVWGLVKTMLLRGGDSERTADEWLSWFERVLRWAGERKLPNRPGRSYPRSVLPRGRKYPNRAKPSPEPPPK